MTIPDDVQEKICILYAEGYSLTLIQKHTHVGRLAVKNVIMRAGVYNETRPFFVTAKTPTPGKKSLSNTSLLSQNDDFVAAMCAAHPEKEIELTRVAG